MTLLSIFTDDQTAIFGCLAAMAGCGLVAALSFHFGPAGKDQKLRQTTIPMNSAPPTDSARKQERRAA